MFFLRIVVLLMGFLVTPMCFAGPVAENTVRNYGKAVADEDWREAVKHFSSTDIKKLRKGFEPLLARRAVRLSFFPGKDPEEIEKLSDAAFAAGIFEGNFKLSRSRGTSIEMEIPKLLGSVKENARLIHFVYRQNGTVNGSYISVVDITTVIKDGKNWFIKLPDEFDYVVASQ